MRQALCSTSMSLALVAVISLWLTRPAQTQPSTNLVLTEAIKQTLKTLPHIRGAPVTDSTLARKVVLVTFFASWCQPCREEFAHLRELHHTYHGAGLEIIAVNYFETFDNLSDATRLKKYLELTQPPFTVVSGNEGVSEQFGTITRIPTLFVFDRQGRRTLHFQNAPDGRQPTLDLATLRQAILPLL